MAQHRHKRDTNARDPRIPRDTTGTTPSTTPSSTTPDSTSSSPRRRLKAAHVAAPLAVVATLSAVTMGVLSAEPASSDTDLLASSSSTSLSASTALANRRDVPVSRSQLRSAAKFESKARKEIARDERREKLERKEAAATRRAVRNADTRLWTTADLNLWTAPGDDAEKVGILDAIERVLVTGRREAGRAEVVVDGRSRWVSADYLAAKKPKPEPKGPSLGGQCSNGSSIDAGRASLYEIHDVVCANWPQITSYGTWRGDGEHGQGRAIDIMTSGSTGWAVAEFLRANYASLGIEYIIYSQKIWSVERSAEGWRGMSDRGSVTANHYDHVHVTVY